MGQLQSGGYVIDNSLEAFKKFIESIDPETKEFAKSLKGLSEEEQDRRIDEWLASLPDDDDD